MKKNIIAILMISLVLIITLASCSADNGSTSTQKVRVIGTAAPATKTRAANGVKIASVDKVIVNGTDITDKLEAKDPNAKPGQNNVVFEAEVEVFEKTSIEASAEEGFVFDEWEVLDDDESEQSEAFLDKIEDWLEASGQEHSEKLSNVPAEYLPYIVAEYDNGYYVNLDNALAEGEKGTKDVPYSVEGFLQAKKNYDDDELTLVLQGSNSENFTKLSDGIKALRLDELKLKSESRIELTTLPSFSEIKFSGFSFGDLEITASGECEYEFEDCNFGALKIDAAEAELELQGGKAASITILSAEEVEIEDMAVEGDIDLSAMKSGEVEIKRTKGIVIKPSSGLDVEIK